MEFGYFTLSDNNYVDNSRGANELVENIVAEALHAEQIGEGEKHMAQATVGNGLGQVCHREVLEILGLWRVGGRAAPWAGAGGEHNPGGCMPGGI